LSQTKLAVVHKNFTGRRPYCVSRRLDPGGRGEGIVKLPQIDVQGLGMYMEQSRLVFVVDQNTLE